MYSGYYPPSTSTSTFGAPPTATSVYYAQQTLSSPTSSSSSTTRMQSSPSSQGGYRKPRQPTTGTGFAEDDLWKYINEDAAMNASTLIPDFGSVNSAHVGYSPAKGSKSTNLGESLSSKYKKAISGSSNSSSPYSSPESSSSSSGSQQTVTFSTCPKCNTVEHHFFQQSRTCGRCGHIRYFSSSKSQSNQEPMSRTYWRPTRYTAAISYAHIIEGREEVDAPVHEALATWASYQRPFIIAMANSVAQLTTDTASCPAFNLELANQAGGGPSLAVVNQGMTTFSALQSDDLLGSFKVLQDEHTSRRARGQRGIVIAVLNCRGASLAFACRLDDGSM
ncbi:hypothetical protein FRB94_005649 [Tulasnella sp. JGI-2019a]|nr:hypothetical protein FRB94_005649 [Tulasnella sp. JGI-2019a]KAG9007255.1 hypothetical protein FRB93_008078 [Tulasnella sp. JGI-2019a]KAG9033563.1 hypothetical protein FRB95_014641 [Tulasnella sp. JGI-2019a]